MTAREGEGEGEGEEEEERRERRRRGKKGKSERLGHRGRQTKTVVMAAHKPVEWVNAVIQRDDEKVCAEGPL